MTPATVSVRPARRNDINSIAALLVQLYEAELPGALAGSSASRQALLRFTLEAAPERSLYQRYVVCWDSEVVGTGMMQFPGEPDFERAPPGTRARARALLGRRGAVRLLVTVARSLIGVHRPKDSGAALVHSVVVDERYRGQGLGRRLMRELEREAASRGCRRAVVQVLAGNALARRLYEQLGYYQVWRTPRWLQVLTWTSYVMQKSLDEA